MVVPRLEDMAALTLFHNPHVIKGQLTRLRTMVPIQEAYSEPARLIQWHSLPRRRDRARLMISKVIRGALSRLRTFMGIFYPEGTDFGIRYPRGRHRPIVDHLTGRLVMDHVTRRLVWASQAFIDFGNRRYTLVKSRMNYTRYYQLRAVDNAIASIWAVP